MENEEKTTQNKTTEETKKTRKSNSGEKEKLMQWKLIIAALKTDEEIKAVMLKRNFSDEKISGIEEQYNKLIELSSKQQSAIGEKQQAQEKFGKLKTELIEFYKSTRTFARLALKEDTSNLKSLGIDEPLKTSFAAMMDKISQFVMNALDNEIILTKLAELGVTRENIETLSAKYNETITAKIEVENETAESMRLTKEKIKKFAEMEKIFKTIITIVKTDLKERPDLLSKMGI